MYLHLYLHLCLCDTVLADLRPCPLTSCSTDSCTAHSSFFIFNAIDARPRQHGNLCGATIHFCGATVHFGHSTTLVAVVDGHRCGCAWGKSCITRLAIDALLATLQTALIQLRSSTS